MFRRLTAGTVLFLFTTEIALAASISTRVRVLENKVGVVERKLNEENRVQTDQLEQIERNTQAIEVLTIKVDKTQAAIAKLNQGGLAKNTTASNQISSARFTDSLYSYP